jgi:hypothetical protein
VPTEKERKQEPAFPRKRHVGLTLRDFFAAAALIGLQADPHTDIYAEGKLARQCFAIADAMLAARQLEIK